MNSTSESANQDLLEEAASIGRLRTDCPVCNGINTFSATYLPNSFQVIYNCFKADCDNRGVVFVGLQKNSNLEHLFSSPRQKDCVKSREQKEFVGMNNFIEVEYSQDAINYLKKVQCYDMHKNKHIKVKYDLKLNRVVFLVPDMKEQHKTVSAVGRTLDSKGTPKWYKYTDQTCEYVIGSGSIAVLCEDIPSACVVSTLDNHVGIGLTGTSVSDAVEQHLIDTKYAKVLICLDKDAALKGISICDRLKSKVSGVSVLFPDMDIKNMTEEYLDNFFNPTMEDVI